MTKAAYCCEEPFFDAVRKKEQVIRVMLAGTGIKPRYKGVKKGTDELLTPVPVESSLAFGEASYA